MSATGIYDELTAVNPAAAPWAHAAAHLAGYPYGEEEIILLEEEVLPVIQQRLQRVDAIDAALQEEQKARIAIEQLRQQLSNDAEGNDALEELLPL